MIKITFDNGEVYTEEQYKKDYVRMMDFLRENHFGDKNCATVGCDDCPLLNTTCRNTGEENSDYRCLDTVEIVHDWAKTHPNKTNREKFIEVFGSNPSFDTAWEFGKWLDDEYKGK